MSLRFKFFFGIGVLFFAMVLLFFFLPEYLVRKDILYTIDDIQEKLTTGERNTIVSSLLDLKDRLSFRLFVQLSLICLVGLILIFTFLVLMGISIISPIRKLAQCTDAIVAGKFDEIILPHMGSRNDEVAALTHAFGNMIQGLQEKEKIRGVLNKVVSKDVAEEILHARFELGGEDRIVTMLFSDIRGFSKLTEHLSPQKTINMLNQCMTKISEVVEGEGGIIDKYVGDEVMALYGAPHQHPDHALRALSAGMLIIETLKKWNHERTLVQEPVLEVGIGIHTGLVVAGNMGAKDRLNYTVLGANVNLAARLCAAAAPNQLLISEYTLNEPHIRDQFHVKELAPILPKGFSQAVKIFEVLSFKWQ